MAVPILDISWYHNLTLGGLLWLTSFTECNVCKIHACCSMCQDSIPFHNWLIFHCMNGPLFIIHSSIDGYWVVSAFFSIMNNASMIIPRYELVFQFYRVYTHAWYCRIIMNIPLTLEELQNCFSQRLLRLPIYIFTSHRLHSKQCSRFANYPNAHWQLLLSFFSL